MRVTLEFDGCTTAQLRAILAECSRRREAWTTGSWQPRVRCEGPECFHVTCDPVNHDTARAILSAAGVPAPK